MYEEYANSTSTNVELKRNSGLQVEVASYEDSIKVNIIYKVQNQG